MKFYTSEQVIRLADLQPGLPCLGVQELLQSKHTCRSVSKLRPKQTKVSNISFIADSEIKSLFRNHE
jgi:hypothetical protein